jgi:hypothetical protein
MDSWGDVIRDICVGAFWPIVLVLSMAALLIPRKGARN